MCNLYSHTKGKHAIIALARAMGDRTGNLMPLPGIFPDYAAPIVCNTPDGRDLAMARWGMPTPPEYLVTKTGKPMAADGGVTNVRNTTSAHWRHWLGQANRCVVPFTSFSEPEPLPNGSKPPIWFALAADRPLAFFAGIYVPGWKSVRKVREGETTNDLFAFLTTKPNDLIKQFHPRAMPVILTTQEEIDTWMDAPTAEALKLQRPLPNDGLVIVARGQKQDGAPDEPPAGLLL